MNSRNGTHAQSKPTEDEKKDAPSGFNPSHLNPATSIVSERSETTDMLNRMFNDEYETDIELGGMGALKESDDESEHSHPLAQVTPRIHHSTFPSHDVSTNTEVAIALATKPLEESVVTQPPQTMHIPMPSTEDTTSAIKPEEETKSDAIDIKPPTKRSLDDIYQDYIHKHKQEPTELNLLLNFNRMSSEANDRWRYKEIKQWWVNRQNHQNESTSKHKAPKKETKSTKKQTKNNKTKTVVTARVVTHDHQPTAHETEELKSNPSTPMPKPLQKPGKIGSLKRLMSSISSKNVFSEIPENSPMTPSALNPQRSVHMITAEDISSIKQILSEYQLLITEEQVTKILTEYKYNKEHIIDDLCKGYGNDQDENIKLFKLLSDVGYKLVERQKFYDVVLKRFVQKHELTSPQFIIMLIKTIHDLKLDDDIDLNECYRLATNAALSGEVFVTDTTKSASKQFAKVFASMNTADVWQRIYRKMEEWTPCDYKQLDFEAIRNILRNDRFLNENEIEILESSLKTAPIDAKKGYNEDRLMDELCDAFTSENDTHNPSNLTQILIEKLECTEIETRRQLYDLLLHKYFTCNQLHMHNFVKILRWSIPQVDDWKLDEDAIATITDIARKNTLDGTMFVKGQEGFKNSSGFAKLFKAKGQERKRFCKLYLKIKQWKSKTYEPRSEPVLVDNEWKIKLIRNAEKDHKLDPLPQYIHKCIWFQSWDEKIEALIDQAVLRLLQLRCWNETFVEKIYSSAINKYYDAVQDVFRETGKHQFFSKFIKQYYERE
eukprot:938274_1